MHGLEIAGEAQYSLSVTGQPLLMSVPSSELPAPERVTGENFLARVNALVDWAALAPAMESLSSQTGVKLPLSAVKIALLKYWYALTDSVTEFTVLDRLSFRSFVGFAGDGSSADVEILNELREGSWTSLPDLQAVVDAAEEQLRGQGFTVRPGSMAEASMIPCTEGSLATYTTSDTLIAQPGEFERMTEAKVARAHAHGRTPTGPQAFSESPRVAMKSDSVADETPVTKVTKGEQVQNERVWAQVEWPWGERSDLINSLQIGRDYAFSPFARELTPYTHVSRRHAELLVHGDSVWIKDLGSRNGTFVNNDEVPTGQAFLIDSDAIVRFGPLLAVSVKLLP
jgi:hypothetical protein